MRILLAGIPGILERPLAQALAGHHQPLTFTDDTRSLADCEAATDCDVVIHGLAGVDGESDRLDAATRGTWNLLTTTRARRYVLLSSMDIYTQYDAGWHVDESWSPRPTTDIDQLAPYLAEVASREISRNRPIECRVLRLDEIVLAETFADGPVQPRWLHIDDAVAAIVRAATVDRLSDELARWTTFNIARGGPGSRFVTGRTATATGFEPAHRGEPSGASPMDAPAFPAKPAPIENLPEPDRILVLGAGGPVGAAAIAVLRQDHRLRLADRRSMAEVAASPPQSEGAPVPSPPEPPHEERLVDITDAAAVRDAAQDMDAIINLTVVRPDPVQAFRVNTLGAWNVMQAAVHHGIRRVVHTGPILTLGKHPSGYVEDRDIASNLPPRPGDNLYFVSKFLGQEICRIFAEQHGIAVPALLFYNFVNPEVTRRRGQIPGPGNISWDDSGRALAAAVRVPRMPEPFVVVHVLADAPHDRYRNDTARHLLGWEPLDRLDDLWYRREG